MDASTRIDDPALRLPRPFVRALLAHDVPTLGAAAAESDSALLALHGVGEKGLRTLRELQRAAAAGEP